mmetsp:Transcript_18664/g.70903  ORF Transcript_18664/g.70903 Transcript_18664/m.70903 type:complete len:233 (-) Transcript_18664:2736-3434(-)
MPRVGANLFQLRLERIGLGLRIDLPLLGGGTRRTCRSCCALPSQNAAERRRPAAWHCCSSRDAGCNWRACRRHGPSLRPRRPAHVPVCLCRWEPVSRHEGLQRRKHHRPCCRAGIAAPVPCRRSCSGPCPGLSRPNPRQAKPPAGRGARPRSPPGGRLLCVDCSPLPGGPCWTSRRLATCAVAAPAGCRLSASAASHCCRPRLRGRAPCGAATGAPRSNCGPELLAPAGSSR